MARAPGARGSPTAAAAPAIIVASAATAAARSATAAARSAAAATRPALLGDVDPQRAAGEVLAVEICDRLLRRVGARHLHEAEPARLTAHPVDHQVDRLDLSGGGEVLGDEVLGGVVGKISDVEAARHGAL